MKATEILAKKLRVNDSWYGVNTYRVLDFDIQDDLVVIVCDNYYNGTSHNIQYGFNMSEFKSLLNGKEVIYRINGEVETRATYILI